MIFRITVYRHGANPIIMPHGHQAVTGAGTGHVWAKMPARSVVTSEVCPVSRGSWQVLCAAPVSPSALWCPPCQLDPGVWSTLSLKGVDLGLPCNPSRTGCGKNRTRGVKIYQNLPKLRICGHGPDHSNNPDVSVWFRALLPGG